MRAFVAIVLLLLVLPTGAHAARPGLDERLNAGAIIRDITVPEGQPWAFVRVRAIIDAAPETVWQQLAHIDRWPTWLPMSRKAEFLSPEAASLVTKEVARDRGQVVAIMAAHPDRGAPQNPSGHWDRLVYEEYDLPFPLKNEWVVRRYTFDEQPDDDRATWRKIDSPDDQNDGSWEVTPWGDGKRTHLRYYYRVKAKEGVPKPVFTAAVALTVNSMIKALRHETAKAPTPRSQTP